VVKVQLVFVHLICTYSNAPYFSVVLILGQL